MKKEKYYKISAVYNGGTINAVTKAKDEYFAMEGVFEEIEDKNLPNLCFTDVARISKSKYQALKNINNYLKTKETNNEV